VLGVQRRHIDSRADGSDDSYRRKPAGDNSNRTIRGVPKSSVGGADRRLGIATVAAHVRCPSCPRARASGAGSNPSAATGGSTDAGAAQIRAHGAGTRDCDRDTSIAGVGTARIHATSASTAASATRCAAVHPEASGVIVESADRWAFPTPVFGTLSASVCTASDLVASCATIASDCDPQRIDADRRQRRPSSTESIPLQGSEPARQASGTGARVGHHHLPPGQTRRRSP
jgi:hypothetical protein